MIVVDYHKGNRRLVWHFLRVNANFLLNLAGVERP